MGTDLSPQSQRNPKSGTTVEGRLRAHRSECGCRESLIALLAGLAVFVWYYLVRHGSAFSVWQKVVAAFVIGLASAVAGKALGLAWARYRYRVLRRHFGAGG